MTITCFNLVGFAHFYRSMARFSRMNDNELRAMIYHLNTANIDSCHLTHPRVELRKMSCMEFCIRLNEPPVRPYHTEVQLYKSMEALCDNIISSATNDKERTALATLYAQMSNIENAFLRAYGMDIADFRTVYGDCASALIPGEFEPFACLKNDNNSLFFLTA